VGRFLGQFKIKKGDDRGATVVEAAMALPILLLILIAIMELGLAFKDYLTVSYISREGARIGALAGDDPEADCAILRGIGEIVTTGDLQRINRIEIYKSDAAGGQGVTNTAVYKPGQDPTLCTVPADPTDGWTLNSGPWPPTSRQTAVGTNPLDIIGVRVILDRTWVSGLPPFSGGFQVNESTITRIEPEVFD